LYGIQRAARRLRESSPIKETRKEADRAPEPWSHRLRQGETACYVAAAPTPGGGVRRLNPLEVGRPRAHLTAAWESVAAKALGPLQEETLAR